MHFWQLINKKKGLLTMKIKKKTILSVTLSAALFFTNVPSVFAAGSTSSDTASTVSQATSSNADQIITNFGGKEDITESLPMDLKIELANEILQDPKDVQIISTSSQIDDLQTVETIVNSSDDELQVLGMTQGEIKDAREDIDRLNSFTDDQIMSKYERDSEQVKLIRKALTPTSNKGQKNLSGNIVTTSDSISSSTLQYSLISASNKKQTKHAASYELDTTYSWITQPLIHAFSDQSAVAWGLNLTPEGPTGTNYYANGLGYYSRSITDIYSPGANRGTIFSFDQEISNPVGDGYCYLDHGYTKETAYQTKASGYTAQVLAQYGHETLGFGFSLGVPPSVSITAGTSENTSAQKSLAIIV
jgi:hypothetical protein